MNLKPMLAVLAFVTALTGRGDSVTNAWMLHSWEGYMPFPSLAETRDAEIDGPILKVADIRGEYGIHLINRTRVSVGKGDRLFVSMLARGAGDLRVRGECYGGGRHLGRLDEVTEQIEGTGWRYVEFTLPLLPGTEGVDFSVGRRDHKDLELADVRATGLPELPIRDLTPSVVAYQDDFEKDRTRPGSPKLVNGILAEGLGERTRYGLYRAVRPLEIFRTKVPAKAGEVVSSQFRFYSFAEKPFGVRGRGRLVETVASGAASLGLELADDAKAPVVEICLSGADGTPAFRIPRTSLPADFRLDLAADGAWTLTVKGLADSSLRRFGGMAPAFAREKGARTVVLALPDAGTKALVDLLAVASAKCEDRPARPPFVLKRDAAFDPVKAGWREVLHDDFDGTEINADIWEPAHYENGWRPELCRLDGQGHVLFRCGYMERYGKIVAASLWSKQRFLWGYFEARLKFTHLPGWNAAFWLYGRSNANPFLDGHEIDIFEDYYTRPSKPGDPSPKRLDHNNHFVFSSVLKSWNYNSTLPRGIDDWYVIGCKRTPFETTYYLDGKPIASTAFHSPWDTVTFDPFSHMAGTRPLHIIFQSGIDNEEVFKRNPRVEDFVVDWVRVYEMPGQDKAPSVAWRNPSDRVMVAPGEHLGFDVSARAFAADGKIEAVYLFDNGNFIDYRFGGEAKFGFPFTRGFFDRTDYMKPGRSGMKPAFNGAAHVFIAFAQDGEGRVGLTDKLIRIPVELKSVPAAEGPQRIPGTVLAKRVDAGGWGVSYYFRSTKLNVSEPRDPTFDGAGRLSLPFEAGDWMNFTVDVAEAGAYAATVDARPLPTDIPNVTWLVDGRLAATSPLPSATLNLPAGRHVLTLVSEGTFDFSKMDFVRK